MFPASAKLCDVIALSASRLSARFSRRRVAKQMRLGIALFAVGASFGAAPLFADSALDASASNAANRVNNVELATFAADANSPADAPFVNDAIPLFCAPPARPSLFCELAGIPAVPSKWNDRANWATQADVAQSLQSTYSSRLPLSPLAPQPTRSPQISPIIRGGYISNLPITPFRGRVFAYADGSWGKQAEQNSDPFASGFAVASFGGGVGQDWRLSKNAIWGFGFQGRNIQLDPDASIYESEIDSLAGFLRLSLFGPLWRLDLSIGAAQNWNEQSLDEQDDVKYSSTQWNYEAEFGVRFDKGYTRVEPLVNVRVLTLQEPAEAERRFVLHGRAGDYSDASYRLKLGSRFSWEYATHLATLKPYLTATWAHEFGDRALYTVGENTPFPVVYRYARHQMARDRLDLGGGVDAALRDTVDVFFRYDVEFAKEYSNYLFYAGFHKKF